VVAPGFKYNMTDLAASIGIHQLKKVKKFQQQRLEIASCYDREFAELPIVLPPRAPDDDLHAWHLYTIRLSDDAPVKRDDFIQLMADHGIGCSVHFIPLHIHPYWRDTYKLSPEDFPNALYAYERVVSLPIYTRMTEKDTSRVTRAVKEILSD